MNNTSNSGLARSRSSRSPRTSNSAKRSSKGYLNAGQKMIAARGWPVVKVFCLDEIAQHKGHGSYRLVISAPEFGIILDVLKERTKEALEAWLDQRG